MVQKIKDSWKAENLGKRPKSTAGAGIILRGAADDRGILNVGGRVGAAYGPEAVRRILGQFMLGLNGELSGYCLSQGDNVELLPTIEATHALIRKTLAHDHREGRIPIVLGGGHDYGFPHIAAASDVFGLNKTALINIDAHLDVRPVVNGHITSGSPYFLALESKAVAPANFVEFGIQEHCNDIEYSHYLKKKKVKILTLGQCREKKGPVAAFKALVQAFAKRGLKIVISVDVDAIQMCQAPGVSAPQADGFTVAELFEMMRICGNSKAVASLGFFELSPPLDTGDQTTRLVATAIHRYASTVAARR